MIRARQFDYDEPVTIEKTSAKSVLAALAANAFVATLKLVAFAFSGSASMLSEAIHSLADTGNQVLLFVGLRRSARQPDQLAEPARLKSTVAGARHHGRTPTGQSGAALLDRGGLHPPAANRGILQP